MFFLFPFDKVTPGGPLLWKSSTRPLLAKIWKKNLNISYSIEQYTYPKNLVLQSVSKRSNAKKAVVTLNVFQMATIIFLFLNYFGMKFYILLVFLIVMLSWCYLKNSGTVIMHNYVCINTNESYSLRENALHFIQGLLYNGT